MLLKIIEENEIRASYYKQGSTFYAPNYEKWKDVAEILVQKGYTINQISEMEESFQAELAFVAKAKRELKKEENLVNPDRNTRPYRIRTFRKSASLSRKTEAAGTGKINIAERKSDGKKFKGYDKAGAGFLF